MFGNAPSDAYRGHMLALPLPNGELIMKTDMQLKNDVNEELSWEPSVHAAGIGIEVHDGVVTLAGHVGSYGEKLDAERAAQRVFGVKALTVEMDVTLPSSSKRNDTDIAHSVENVFDWMTVWPKGAIKVKVEDAYITLSGEVHWQYQREAAVVAVRYLTGVKGVIDLVEIKPKVSASVVKTDIEAALKRSAEIDAKNITVDVNGSDITLAGRVKSWSERDSARHSAWASPGVRTVVDNIVVAF